MALSYEDRQLLRKVVLNVHMQYYPKHMLTDYEADKVISAGNLVEVIKQEDIVWYDKHAGHGIEFEDKFYFVLKASDIVMVD